MIFEVKFMKLYEIINLKVLEQTLFWLYYHNMTFYFSIFRLKIKFIKYFYFEKVFHFEIKIYSYNNQNFTKKKEDQFFEFSQNLNWGILEMSEKKIFEFFLNIDKQKNVLFK